jgi:exodeoxyribonuclease VII small subunit
MAKRQDQAAEEATAQELSFEQALQKLEQTVAALEEGQLGLDQSLAHYERGITYLRQCYRQLERAQRKIEVLARIDEDGQVHVEPFDDADMSLEQKQAARSRRRSRAAGEERPGSSGMDDAGTLF